MSRAPAARALAAGVVAGATVTAAWNVLSRQPDPSARWQRRNFRDREVTLRLGPAIGAGALAGAVVSGRPGRSALLTVVGTAAAVGAYDDLYGDSHARGLGGHLRALRRGRLTTGMVKLVSLVAAAAIASARRHRRPVDAFLGTVLVAGTANLVNLLDLRPGRAAKASAVAAAALCVTPNAQGRAVAAVAGGAALAALPPDLGERAMLGDCGAGTLGALIGWSAATGGGRPRRMALAAGVVGLTLASERVSFSAVIERHPVLRAFDQLGRPAAVTEPGKTHNVARVAILIAIVTVLARLAGFARVVVFTRIVGPSCLGDTYFTANTVPNIVFDIVAGGALTSLVVPVLAGPVTNGDRDTVNRTTSALLTWAVSILVPMTLLGLLITHPLMRVLVGNGHPGCSAADEVAVGARMLAVFMPQVLLYGIAVVMIGVNQAHRRFLGGAIGPLVSSLVVIAAYITFGAVAAHRETDLSTLTRWHELILSVGTTLGVGALLITMLVNAYGTKIRLRPTYRFPPGIATTIRAMAISGAVVVSSQDIATAVVLRLANNNGSDGSVVLYNLAWTVFTVPWAVAAVPLATTAFPGLTAAWQRGDRAAYAATTARTARVMAIVAAGTAAVMGAAAGPLARVVVHGAPGGVAPTVLARALATFAPGLVGYAFVALLSRSLYAQNNARTPAAAVAVGWLVSIVADIALVAALPTSWTVAAFGIGTSIGVTVSAVWLLIALHRTAGTGSLARLPRAAGAALAGGAAGTAVGALIARAAPGTGVIGQLVIVAVVAVAAVIVHAGIVGVLDRPTLRLLVNRERFRRA